MLTEIKLSIDLFFKRNPHSKLKLHHTSTQPDVDGASCDISNPNVLGCKKGKDSTQSQSAVVKNCTEKTKH